MFSCAFENNAGSVRRIACVVTDLRRTRMADPIVRPTRQAPKRLTCYQELAADVVNQLTAGMSGTNWANTKARISNTALEDTPFS